MKFYTFYYWYRCHQQRLQSGDDKSGFVKLQIEEKTAAAVSVEIHFPGEVRLFFHEPVSPAYLKTLLR